MRRSLLFTVLLGLVTFLATSFPVHREGSVLDQESLIECTAGVADGDVTVDGRPLLCKLRNQCDTINDGNCSAIHGCSVSC